MYLKSFPKKVTFFDEFSKVSKTNKDIANEVFFALLLYVQKLDLSFVKLGASSTMGRKLVCVLKTEHTVPKFKIFEELNFKKVVQGQVTYLIC